MRSVDSCCSQHFCLFLQTVFLNPKGFFFFPWGFSIGTMSETGHLLTDMPHNTKQQR